SLDTTGVRFQVAGDVLAISVSVMHPGGLGVRVPMVVGMRALALDFSGVERFTMDSVFEMDAITDRTNRRISQGSTQLVLPPREITVMWSAMNAPRSGWMTKAVVDDFEIRKVARNGIRRVGEMLPHNTGGSVFAKILVDVWAEPIGDPTHVEFPS